MTQSTTPITAHPPLSQCASHLSARRAAAKRPGAHLPRFAYDWGRVTRLCLYAAAIGTPIGHYWFAFLDKVRRCRCQGQRAPSKGPALQCVAPRRHGRHCLVPATEHPRVPPCLAAQPLHPPCAPPPERVPHAHGPPADRHPQDGAGPGAHGARGPGAGEPRGWSLRPSVQLRRPERVAAGVCHVPFTAQAPLWPRPPAAPSSS